MVIAFVISETFSIYSFNGIRIQAETWAEALMKKGHKVIKVNPWDKHNWEEYDIIHIVGPCEFLLQFTSSLVSKNKNIVFSPIIDTIQPKWKYKLVSYWGCSKLRLSCYNHDVRLAMKNIKQIYVRSQYEADYVHICYSVPLSKIEIVPLSYRISPCLHYPQKENFCLHVSILTSERKNVLRLIKAAIKYKFKLILAGSIDSEEKFRPIDQLIKKHNNISYLGKVPEEQLIELYSRAKVFALPSINEGVGMVALEAAVYGCNIVITEIGGPKEYYNNKAYIVNPFDIDDIGKKIELALADDNQQPSLMEYIQNEYSLDTCTKKLITSYNKIVSC